MSKDETKALLDSRRATYGDRVKNMEAVADMVNGYMDGVEQRDGTREMTGADFAMSMVLYKAYRFAVTPDYSDNIDDMEGYLQMVRECVGDNMIHARSADEYQQLKQDRKMAGLKQSDRPVRDAIRRMSLPPVETPKPQEIKPEHWVEVPKEDPVYQELLRQHEQLKHASGHALREAEGLVERGETTSEPRE